MDITHQPSPLPDPHPPDSAPDHPSAAVGDGSPDGHCPLCGGPLVGLHCKLVCHRCGYREDCSDLFPVRRNEP